MAITTVGFTGAGNKISGATTVNDFDYLAIGDGNTAFAVGDTTLVSEITDSGLARIQVTPTQSGAVTTWTYEWTASGTKTIKEAGILNASSTGTLLARQVLGTERAVTSGNTYTLTATLTLS